jgi:collagen beta-1,O-galactosyltransferase
LFYRYLGRKRLFRTEEAYVEGTASLVWPSYSYWTLSYLMSDRGVEKLLKQKPLSKMVPVDEFLPIMFDKHPT